MDLKKEINKINNERLPNTNRTERLITLFTEYHQSLQLLQPDVSNRLNKYCEMCEIETEHRIIHACLTCDKYI